jgi:hypothetical protein
MYPSSYQRFRSAREDEENIELSDAGGNHRSGSASHGDHTSAQSSAGSQRSAIEIDAVESDFAAGSAPFGHFSAYRLAQRQHVLGLHRQEKVLRHLRDHEAS